MEGQEGETGGDAAAGLERAERPGPGLPGTVRPDGTAARSPRPPMPGPEL